MTGTIKPFSVGTVNPGHVPNTSGPLKLIFGLTR